MDSPNFWQYSPVKHRCFTAEAKDILEKADREMRIGLRIIRVIIFAALLTGIAPRVSLAAVTCGQTITQDTVLTSDLVCPPGTVTALVIGASDVTLDLGGHRLSGHYIFPPSQNVARGIVVAGDLERVLIRNGLIEGFNEGIGIFGGARGVAVSGIAVRNLVINNPDYFAVGVNIADSQDVVVEDSSFQFAPVAHKDAVALFRSSVRVQRIQVRGGAIGVSIGGGPSDCGPPNAPTTGDVLDSTFLNLTSTGVFFQCTSRTRIAGNTFASPDLGAEYAGNAIGSHAPYPGAVSGITMENNLVDGLVFGIKFQGIVNSTVADNRVMDNGAYGIRMDRSLKCDHLEDPSLGPLPPGYECFYSTGNIIRDNEVLGSGIADLSHDPLATGNSWQNNTCLTTEGAEIAPCNCPDSICGGSYRGWRLQLLRKSR